MVGNDNLVYFADPIFREYRQSGNVFIRDITQKIIESLIGKPITSGLMPTIMSVPRRRNNDLIITLLHYIPIRKSLDIDVIEQGQTFAGETIVLPPKVKSLFCVSTSKTLTLNKDGAFELPMIKGRLLLEARGYFS